MEERAHEPVLLEAVLNALQPRAGGVYVDATFGRGGHAGAILRGLGDEGRLLAMDQDPEAVAVAEKEFAGDDRFEIRRGPFSMLGQYVQDLGLIGQVDGILLDLGVSSPQLDEPARGFSFRHAGPLDMRMDPDRGESAADWLNRATEQEIARVIRDYGEERFARRIARTVVAEREQAPIETTEQLAAICVRAVPTREPGKDPATRTFQAIRIHINHELDELESALPQAVEVLREGGRLAVISFHSLEDRIVKRFMQKEARGDEFPPDLPIPQSELKPRLRIVGKPVRAGTEEVQRNPRARSAVLRVAERIGVRP
ncbi:MAG: 16S rRNA (cytosine(1402)-N(4))-methyltransferase RsmH [Acidiferrobacteraceae bacterium]